MRRIVLLLLTLSFLGLSACHTDTQSLYRKPTPVEQFEELEQTAELQPIPFNPSVDILFVIDDSRSMTSHITNLSRSMKKFVEAFASHDQIDFHIGVTTVWDSGRYKDPVENPNGIVPQFQIDPNTGQLIKNENGGLVRNFWNKGELIPIAGTENQRFVTRSENFKEELENTLLSIKPQNFVRGGDLNSQGNVIPGVGPEVEELFSPALANLTSPVLNDPNSGINKNFWRTSSHKVFVFVTDADDASPQMSFEDFNRRIKDATQGQAEEDYSFYAVIHPLDNSCPKDPGIKNISSDQFKLKQLISLTGGKALNICRNFGEELAEVGEEIRERTLSKIEIPLQKFPEFFSENPENINKDWLEVHYGDQKLPLYNVEGWGWSWNPENNTLIIRGVENIDYIEGAEFSVDFTSVRL